MKNNRRYLCIPYAIFLVLFVVIPLLVIVKYAFTDASGKDSITIQKNPENVVNLYASFTTLWYEAGGEVTELIGGDSSVALYEEYIGRDITADAGVTTVATSSSGKEWDTETVIALRQ